MKYYLTYILFIICSISFSQNIDDKRDLLINDLCNILTKNKNLNDLERINLVNQDISLVEYFKDNSGALEFHKKMQREKPLKIDNGKIISGYLALTPVTQFTHYTAFAVLDEIPIDIN